MRTIYQAKNFIRSNYGNKVKIKLFGMRNKIEVIEGIICECYKHIFLINTSLGKKSFTYTDVLLGNIRVIVK